MGKQPAVIIIARHGARLDQVDKQWYTTAAKPYDPPLSYGGWMQCQKLGARIATELQNLDNPASLDPQSRDTAASSGQHPRKRRKIMIHSSPYLRCIQTSIAVAAGLRHPQHERQRPLPTPHQRSSLSRPSIVSDTHRRTSGLGGGDAPTASLASSQVASPGSSQMQLRIDPYLSEWLSPSYFEHTTAPPSSEAMVQSAREYLKSPPEDIKGTDISSLSIHEFPAVDWAEKENELSSSAAYEKMGLRGMAAVGHSFPHRSRTVSLGKELTNGISRSSLDAARRRSKTATYSPPVPTYSLASQDPIPVGFVAHARDACVEPKPDWDSAALGWGDGGQFNEEWSSMHRRLRNGLQMMLAYYEDLYPEVEADTENEEDEDEVVLILVTHQAGCNALIRLLTGAPALHDVGTASLTLAVRRSNLGRQPSGNAHSPTRRRGSLDLGFADEFDVKIIASTEHLRSGSNFLGLNSPRLGKSPAFASRRMVGADSLEGFSIGDPLAWRTSSTHTLGRSPSYRSHAADAGAKSASTGLWGQSRGSRDETSDAADSDAAFPSPKTQPSIPEEIWSPGGDLSEEVAIGRSASISSNGLWEAGGGGLQARGSFTEGSINRARSPAKRRWTAVERSP